MKLIYASEYRMAAQNSLHKRWTEAVLTWLVAYILGGGLASPVVEFTINFIEKGTETLSSYSIFYGLASVFGIIALAAVILNLVLGGVIETGYARYNMKLVNGMESGIDELFHDFNRWTTCFLMQLIRDIITTVGYSLLIFPGIIADYGFKMAPYILAEHPDYTAWQALKESWEMMKGHKWRLFCLDFSFIGWYILAVCTCNIGFLWLNPYENAAESIFYLELAGDYYSRATII